MVAKILAGLNKPTFLAGILPSLILLAVTIASSVSYS